MKALVDKISTLQGEITSADSVVQNALGQCISHITEIKQKVQQHTELIQTLQSEQAIMGSGESSSSPVLQTKVQSLELKTGTFEGIVTTLHREIERCITAIENVERNRQTEKQLIENQEKKIRTLERSISLKVSCVLLKLNYLLCFNVVTSNIMLYLHTELL